MRRAAAPRGGTAAILLASAVVMTCLKGASSQSSFSHRFDGMVFIDRTGASAHMSSGTVEHLAAPMTDPDWLSPTRAGCGLDPAKGLIVFATSDETWKYGNLHSIDRTKDNAVAVDLVTYAGQLRRVTGLAVDIEARNVYVAHLNTRASPKIDIVRFDDYTTPAPKGDPRLQNNYAGISTLGDGGGIAILGRELFVCHSSSVDEKFVSKCNLDDGSCKASMWTEVAKLPVPAGDILLTLVSATHPTGLYVSVKPAAGYPGDVIKVDPATGATEVIKGVTKKCSNQPCIAVVKGGTGIASVEDKDAGSRLFSMVITGYSLPDPTAESEEVGSVGPTNAGSKAGPVCFAALDECMKTPTASPVCPDDQTCDDPDPDKPGDYTCSCVAPKTGTPGVAKAADCKSGDDCAMSPCGADQECKDDGMAPDMKFTCECKAPKVGAPGTDAPAAMCADADDCATSPCGADQDCKDDGMAADTMFTCECKAPKTGTGMNAPAAMCADPTDDCATSPCGADQDCKDDGMAPDMKFTCECKAPKTGTGMNAPAMCADPADDCATSPCGADQDCKDDGMAPDMKFTCECKAPKTGTGMDAPAMCADPTDDCAMSPCGADQDCKDDGMAPDMKFTCECKAPKVGAPGTDAPAAMCADPADDCATSPCGADQDCKDDGMAADTKFTCECKAPKVGAPGTDAPAAMCADPADDCATSPCGADQDCKDDGMAADTKFTCECKAPKVGAPGTDAPAAMCADPGDDCAQGMPCGADQECKDDGMAADTKFTCECKAPLVGDPGVNGKAMCAAVNDCTATPGLCRSPTGKDNQECKDTDDSVNQKYTCICKTGKGQPGDSAPAKCDDCDVGKCPGQTCDDPDSSINDAYKCSCKPPFTGDVADSKPATCIKLDCEPNPCGENAKCQDHLAKDDENYYCSCLHIDRVMRGDPQSVDAGCPAAPTPAPDDENGFALGLIIGIVGALLLCALIALLVWCLCCRRQEDPIDVEMDYQPLQPEKSVEREMPPMPPPRVDTPEVEAEPIAVVEVPVEEEEEEEDDDELEDTLSDIEQADDSIFQGEEINATTGSPTHRSTRIPSQSHRSSLGYSALSDAGGQSSI